MGTARARRERRQRAEGRLIARVAAATAAAAAGRDSTSSLVLALRAALRAMGSLLPAAGGVVHHAQGHQSARSSVAAVFLDRGGGAGSAKGVAAYFENELGNQEVAGFWDARTSGEGKARSEGVGSGTEPADKESSVAHGSLSESALS
eukprot:9077092-Alexandrium_andersonii.AAC.1